MWRRGWKKGESQGDPHCFQGTTRGFGAGHLCACQQGQKCAAPTRRMLICLCAKCQQPPNELPQRFRADKRCQPRRAFPRRQALRAQQRHTPATSMRCRHCARRSVSSNTAVTRCVTSPRLSPARRSSPDSQRATMSLILASSSDSTAASFCRPQARCVSASSSCVWARDWVFCQR